MFDPGSELSLLYPLNTHVRHIADSAQRERNIVVRSVRDLVSSPLTVDEFLRRPYVNRSRWLVRAFEPEAERHRQFYLGSSPGFRSPGMLRVGLYEPGESRPARILAREFGPTVRERQILMRLLRRWDEQDFGTLQLRILCDDLRVINLN